MIDSTVRYIAAPDRSLETTGWLRGIAKSVIPADAVTTLTSFFLLLSYSQPVRKIRVN